MGYIVYWVSDFILPTLIFYNLLIKKKHNYFIFGIFFYIFIFYVFGAKIFLAILSFIIFFYYLFVFNLKLKLFFFKNCFLLYGFFACFVLILILLLIQFESFNIFDSAKYLFTRIYFIQARNFYLYYDVFNFSDFYFFTNIQLLKEFGFHEISPSKLVSSFWGKGNLTSHYLSIEGIATLGVFGIILSSFILLFILRFIDDFEHFNDKENVLFIYYFIITTYFINVNLSVIILTHGLFILIFLCFLKLEN